MPRAPALFISHGAPTFATEPGVLGPKLQALGESLSDVSAVLIVSPHWQTSGVQVMATAQPETIHDFGGFPAELYQLRYPAPGAPELAAETARLLADAGFNVSTDDQRGFDHGAWVPLRHLFPAAQLPAFQVSMPYDLSPADALRLGRALAPLRERGVLVIGSGSLTHNLYEVRRTTDKASYAVEFASWVRQAVLDRQTDRLVDYRRQAPHALRAHPTEEHYLPLLVAVGASLDTDAPATIEGGMTYSVLSMDSFGWGMSQGADERP